MQHQELEKILSDRCEKLNLKEKAFTILEKTFTDNTNDDDFWCGYNKSEIKLVFDCFRYEVEKRPSGPIITTKILLCIDNSSWLDNLEPIGSYELQTDFDGNSLDDYFIIKNEKHLKDIGIDSHFKSLNKLLPIKYLRRNHVQYEYVTYVSLVGTLFISKNFESAAVFINRAFEYLKKTDNALFDKDYLKESKTFLKMIKHYLIEQRLISKELADRLPVDQNGG